ncbi:hypothetical protein IFT75_02795 [Pseudomonas sp. CFBP 8758]|uniref:hypothetical protein n=1 Tax=Pseudomonas sp. CFBP 8758 TaxID=2775286 RepID=UPI0017824E0B|nr:hypothetical protein [Pseudomonas sp. CFBP 8758]MBD8592328.1 hypothetical protein [Pseudomonas sp. CFBP 8758]
MKNAVHLSALEYVRATGGNATLAHFHEDHEPVGPAIWDQLLTEGLVLVDVSGKIRLTSAGAKALSQGTAKGLSRAREQLRASRPDDSMDLTNPLNPISPLSPLHNTHDSEPARFSSHCSSSSYGSDSSSSYSSSDSCSSSSDSSSSSSD